MEFPLFHFLPLAMTKTKMQDVVTSGKLSASTSLLPILGSSSSPSAKPRSIGTSKSPAPFRAKLEGLAKKRLVDQFYTPKDGGLSVPQSYTDLVSVFRQGLPAASPHKEEAKFDSMTFDEAVRNGRLEYTRFDLEITCPANLADAMLNVDSEWSEENELEGVILVLESTAVALERNLARKEFRNPQQLSLLADYLANLLLSVHQLHSELSEFTLKLKSQYSSDLQVSVNKLERLEQSLEMLTTRLNESKAVMASTKHIMTEEMVGKIGILQYISGKFVEYDQVNRQNRVRQVTWGLSVLVLLVGIYIAFSHLVR